MQTLQPDCLRPCSVHAICLPGACQVPLQGIHGICTEHTRGIHGTYAGLCAWHALGRQIRPNVVQIWRISGFAF